MFRGTYLRVLSFEEGTNAQTPNALAGFDETLRAKKPHATELFDYSILDDSTNTIDFFWNAKFGAQSTRSLSRVLCDGIGICAEF